MNSTPIATHIRLAIGCALTVFLLTAAPGQQFRQDASAVAAPDTSIPLPDYTRDANPALNANRPMIQLALLLDTSSSMDGLIAQAKSQLWAIVNAFVNVKRDGATPQFQVALYEYGRNSLDPGSGFVRKVVGLTDDLDAVSEQLMELQATRVSGSDERCGWVLHRAVQELGWSRSTDDLKVICIAGNESFAQGDIDFRIPCAMAVRSGININTIFCGGAAEGERLLWKLGAQLGEGSYTAIDQHIETRTVAAPQDDELTLLNAALNRTYVPYTEGGIAAQQRQLQADAAAEGLAQASLSERAGLKASRFYQTDWDLVEAAQDEAFDLSAVPAEALPEPMQKLSEAQRRTHLAQLAAQRETIRKQIAGLSAARARYLAGVQQQDRADTLDKAVVESLKAQALKKKFTSD